MKNKGFTLIELLAVIVILALIALITIPMINNVIEKAKKGALEDSVYGLKSAAELYYGTTGTSETIEFTCDETGCKDGDKKLPFKGTVNLGRVKLFSDGKVSICIEDGGYASHMMVKDKKATTITGSCDYTKEEYAITELVSANEYKKILEENNKIKNALHEKTIISSINNNSDTIVNEIKSLDLNQGEAANKKAIADSLKYSDLGITEDMSWEEITTILSNKFPTTLSMIRSGWTVSESASIANQSYTSNSSQIRLESLGNSSEGNGESYLTSPEFDIDAFKTLSVYGTSFKHTSNTSGSGWYCPTLYLVDANNNKTQLWQHSNVNADDTSYTINFSKDITALKGKYRLQIRTAVYSKNTTYTHTYMTLTKALLSA